MKLERRIRALESRADPDPAQPLAVVEDKSGRRYWLLPGGRLEPEATAPERPVKLWRGIDFESV